MDKTDRIAQIINKHLKNGDLTFEDVASIALGSYNAGAKDAIDDALKIIDKHEFKMPDYLKLNLK